MNAIVSDSSPRPVRSFRVDIFSIRRVFAKRSDKQTICSIKQSVLKTTLISRFSFSLDNGRCYYNLFFSTNYAETIEIFPIKQ